jgi:hypothetical protein
MNEQIVETNTVWGQGRSVLLMKRYQRSVDGEK